MSREREDEVGSVLRYLTSWPRRRSDVRALAIVGSWARGTPRQDSDVDVLLLTDSPGHHTTTTAGCPSEAASAWSGRGPGVPSRSGASCCRAAWRASSGWGHRDLPDSVPCRSADAQR
ncbi:nucleotidyltransferase domain-containing protein [Geodermatophilus dictyosporus]|uniref:nucleotidyltransferase domain-containing protein n=1 Tax=Geodermatophilus dictyosporus TaxID=1523247 RepID=UPI00145C1AFE